MSETATKAYKSPIRKLLSFFEKSRDGWKKKHQQAKAECKRLGNQVRAVERSRKQWRQRAEEYQRRVGELERELEAQKGCLA